MAFSPTDAVFEGFRVARREPASLAIWAVVYFVAIMIFVVGVLMIVGLGAVTQFANGAVGAATPEQLKALMTTFLGAFAVFLPFGFFVAAVLRCAVYRAVLRPEDKGVAYLRVGADELRVMLVMFVLAILGLAAVGVPAAAIGAAVAILWRTSHVGAVLLGVAGSIGFICAAIWVGVRMSLAPVDTFGSRAIRIWEGWGITRARFWDLLGMYLIRFLLAVVLSFAGGVAQFVFQLMAGVGGFAAGGGGEHPNFAAAAPALIIGGLGYIAVSLAIAVLQIANAYGPEAAAWRDLTGHDAASVF